MLGATEGVWEYKSERVGYKNASPHPSAGNENTDQKDGVSGKRLGELGEKMLKCLEFHRSHVVSFIR